MHIGIFPTKRLPRGLALGLGLFVSPRTSIYFRPRDFVLVILYLNSPFFMYAFEMIRGHHGNL